MRRDTSTAATPDPRPGTRDPRPALSVRALTVRYGSGARGSITALRDVSLSLAHGELAGLVGPNGSGKTTLIRAVTGVVRPLAGEIRIAGDNVDALSVAALARRVAVVPQDPRLPEPFTALDAVLMGRTPHLRLLEYEGPADLDAARRAMLATATWELAGRRIAELSGGERQRVVVARALAQEAPLLLLDEPTAHLDIGHQAAVLDLMRRLCRDEGKAVLAAIHDLTLAAQFCDRLLLLDRGSLVAEGPPAEVLSPGLLSEVYGATVQVFAHPQTGRPVIVPQPPGA